MQNFKGSKFRYVEAGLRQHSVPNLAAPSIHAERENFVHAFPGYPSALLIASGAKVQ